MRKRLPRVLAFCLLGAGALAVAAIRPERGSCTPPGSTAEPTIDKQAQDAADRRLKRLSHELNLSTQQKAKIRPLLEHEVERTEEVRTNTSLSEGEAQKRIHAIHKDTNQRIGQLLTPEQRKQWPEDPQQKNAGTETGDHPGESGVTPVSLPTP